ncbi:MAG: hypothetical protein U0S48_13090 [Solirubrobacteraceae bacterium]
MALRAAAVAGSGRLDQDAVALAAGSVLSPPPRSGSLPPGERGRDDFRVALPVAAAGAQVGTSARGLARAIERLAGGALTVVPATGAWSTGALETLLDRALGSPAPLAAIANLDVARLWDARAGRPPHPVPRRHPRRSRTSTSPGRSSRAPMANAPGATSTRAATRDRTRRGASGTSPRSPASAGAGRERW